MQIYVTEHIYQSFQNPALENQMPRPFGKQLQECVTNYLDVLVYLSNNRSCYEPRQLACLTSITKLGATEAYCNRSLTFLFSSPLLNSYVCILKTTVLPGVKPKWLFINTDDQKLGQATGAGYCCPLAIEDSVASEIKLRQYLRP